MSNKKTKAPAPEKVEEPKVTEAVEPTIDAPVEPEVTETKPEEDIPIKKVGVVKDCGSLNIRASADIKSESLGTIPVGEEVEIIDECPGSDFYEVVYGSLSGFSMKQFIGLVAAEE
jgi:hypothetical protein